MRKALGAVCELAGIAGLSYGLFLAWQPLGIMVAGLCIAAIGVALGRES